MTANRMATDGQTRRPDFLASHEARVGWTVADGPVAEGRMVPKLKNGGLRLQFTSPTVAAVQEARCSVWPNHGCSPVKMSGQAEAPLPRTGLQVRVEIRRYITNSGPNGHGVSDRCEI
jgi:hypothetical protein